MFHIHQKLGREKDPIPSFWCCCCLFFFVFLLMRGTWVSLALCALCVFCRVHCPCIQYTYILIPCAHLHDGIWHYMDGIWIVVRVTTTTITKKQRDSPSGTMAKSHLDLVGNCTLVHCTAHRKHLAGRYSKIWLHCYDDLILTGSK